MLALTCCLRFLIWDSFLFHLNLEKAFCMATCQSKVALHVCDAVLGFKLFYLAFMENLITAKVLIFSIPLASFSFFYGYVIVFISTVAIYDNTMYY